MKALEDISSQIEAKVLGGPPTPHTGQTRGRARICQHRGTWSPRVLEQRGQGTDTIVECVSLRPTHPEQAPLQRLLHGVCFLVSMMRVTAPHHGAASVPRSSHPRAHPPHLYGARTGESQDLVSLKAVRF